MEKKLGQEYSDRSQRVTYLKDNCDEVENKMYMKPFSEEELQEYKEGLADTSIKIAELESEQKSSAAYYRKELKSLREDRNTKIERIKEKAELVTEMCYKFVDQNERKVGYYNAEGDLIEVRPATTKEMQPVLFPSMHATKTGTEE